MPTNLPNRAQITYTYGGNQDTVLSNQTNTTLIDQYTMEVTKQALTTEIRAGGSVTYVLRMENTGSGVLYNPSFTDDLGRGTATEAPLSYVENSALFYQNGTQVTGLATVSDDGVTFTSSVVLQPGDNLIVVYDASTSEGQVDAITNTVTGEANSGSVTGTVINDTASETITPQSFANVSIFKNADKATVVSGDTLVYTFTLMNTGTQAADSISFVDDLPDEFTVTSVSYTVNGNTTAISNTDYTIETGNVLVIPAESSSLVIGVPAATSMGPGITTITVTGTIS